LHFIGQAGQAGFTPVKWFLISPQYHLPELPRRNRLRIPQGRRGRLGRQDYIIFPFPEERKKVKSTCGGSLGRADQAFRLQE